MNSKCAYIVREAYWTVVRSRNTKKIKYWGPEYNTSSEHLTSSTEGHIINGSPTPSGFWSSDTPDDIDDASSVIHFSSNEPSDENCNKAKL